MPLLQIRGVCFNVPYPGLIPCVCQPASPTRALRRSRATESRFCAPPPRHRHPRSQFFINKSSINNFPMCCQEKQRAQQRAAPKREARSETTRGQTFSSLLSLPHSSAAAHSSSSFFMGQFMKLAFFAAFSPRKDDLMMMEATPATKLLLSRSQLSPAPRRVSLINNE
jgi:hypothetical protein